MASSSSNANGKTNALSSVVSNLVRASMGTSLSPTVTDEDLDRHVAELILKEAKKKAEKYNQHGIRAYITNNLQDSNAPRANKRFLSSIIRSTDDHNKAILKAQAEAAEEIKRARREEEKRERRARAEEAVRARIARGRSRKSLRRSWREEREGDKEDGWDRWNGRAVDRAEDRKKRKIRSWETLDVENTREGGDETEEERNRRRREKGGEESKGKERQSNHGENRDRHRSRRKHEDESAEDKRRRRRRSRSASPRHQKDRDEDRYRKRSSPSRHHRSRSHSSRQTSEKKEQKHAPSGLRENGAGEDGIDEYDRHDHNPVLKVKEETGSIGPSPSRTPLSYGHKRAPSRSRSRSSRLSPKPKPKYSKPPSRNSSRARSSSPSSHSSLSPGPSPPTNLPSKMDKYFEESYDPRLDVTPLNSAPLVPSTGLINNTDFEGWDAMLELIQIRRQDKEDRKRLERLGLVDKKDKKGKGKEKERSEVIAGTSLSGGNLLDIEYKKRGSVREWDLGKEGVDLSF